MSFPTAVCTPCPCPSDSKVRKGYDDLVDALQKIFGEKSSTEPAKKIDLSNFFGVVKGDCKFCNKPVYQKPHWAKRIWPSGRYSHGDDEDGCNIWNAYLTDLEEKTMAKAKPRRTSWRVWKFIQMNPLTIMSLLVMVLILLILLMTGVLEPIFWFCVGALKYLWASFLDLLRGMLCPCGPKWDPDNFVPADVAEGYVDRITHLEQNNKDLQMKLDWATRQHGPMPDPPVDNTAQTPEPATTSMSGAMLVAMNVVTTVVTGAGCLLAYWAMGENPELGTATGMSMPGMAAQKRALP